MPNKNKQNKFLPIILMLVMTILMVVMVSGTSTNTITYSELIGKFENQQVTEFTVNFGTGKLQYMEQGSDTVQVYSLPSIDLFLMDTKQYIEEYNEAHPSAPLKYNYQKASSLVSDIINWLPVVIMGAMFAVFFFSMNQQGGGKIGNIGKARIQTEDQGRKATFKDVAGCDEEKEELEEIIEYLKNPSAFSTLGAKIPHGVLLVGPPGTGKTLLARAVAGEANVPFHAISGSDFVELYVGVGASRVRDLFDKAKRTRPSIIFIDEIDAVGRQRGAGLGGGHDEREQTLNQLLVEMDGFGINDGVIVMAATNRADILDSALLRPGRFDRQVYVGLPDIKGREEILKVHARNKPLGPDVDLGVIARTTSGFTGADLENLLNEAALLAARKKKKAITQQEIEAASIKVMVGPEKKSRVVTEKEKKLTSFHEAGHAIAAYFTTPNNPVHQISIIPTGQAGGYTLHVPTEDVNYSTKGEMLGEIVVLLGGRVAEAKTLDDISTGASNDLERATAIARKMVTKYGFSDKMGPVVYDTNNEVFLGRDFTQSRNYSEHIATDIDHEVRAIVEECYEKCAAILDEHRDKLNAVAEKLMSCEKISGEEFNAIMKQEENPVAETEVTEAVEATDTVKAENTEIATE